MVGKLFKQDVMDSYKAYAPVVGMTILGTVLTIAALQLAINNTLELLSTFMMLAVFALSITVFVLSIRANIYVIYTSIYHKNGYRLFTLPVKTWQILVSKVLVAFFWSIIMGVLLIVSILVIGITTTGSLSIFTEGFSQIFGYLQQYLDTSVVFFAILDNILTFTLSTLVVLFAGSIAHSSFFQQNRGLITVGVVLIISIILGQIGSYVDTSFASVIVRFAPEALAKGTNIPLGEMGLVMLYQILVCGFLSYGTLWFWNHKLEIM